MTETNQILAQLNQLKAEDPKVFDQQLSPSKSTGEGLLLSNKTAQSTSRDSEIVRSDQKNSEGLLKKKRDGKQTDTIEGEKKKGKNRSCCSICRKNNNEALIHCKRCPKSFHQTCLKLKEASFDVFYCSDCKVAVDQIKKRALEMANSKAKRAKSKRENDKVIEKTESKKNETASKTAKSTTNGNHKVAPDFGSGKQSTIDTMFSNNANYNLNGSKILPELQGNLEQPCLNLNETLYNGERLKEAEKDSILETLTFEQLNNIEVIIREVLKTEKIHSYVGEYIRKSLNQNFLAYKPCHSKKKKKKKKPASKSRISSSTTAAPQSSQAKTASSRPIPKDKEIENKRKEEEKRKWEEIERKKEERKFQNIRYPIDDAELFSKWRSYRLEEKYLIKTQPSKLLIPSESFMKVYKIYDFVHTFNEVIEISIDFSVEMLYYSINSIESPGNKLFKEVIVSLLSLLIDEILELDYNEEFPEDIAKDLLLLKLMFKNPKFKRESLLEMCFTVVLEYIIASEKYSMMASKELLYVAKTFRQTRENTLFFELGFEDKLLYLNFLVSCCLDAATIRNKIEDDLAKKVELKRDKNQIEIEIRSLESKKRELERSEKQTKPTEKIVFLNNQLNRLTDEFPHLGRKELSIKRKELEVQRDEFKEIIKELEDNELKRNKLTIKLDKVLSELFALSSNSQRMIGLDGLGNKYFIFRSKNNMIRVHVNKANDGSWGHYSNEEHLAELFKTLTDKGKNEKQLIEKLTGINTKIISNAENDPETEYEVLENIKVWANTMRASSKLNKEVDQFFGRPISEFSQAAIQLIIATIMNLEQKFVDNLFKDNKEWDTADLRSDFIAKIRRSSESNDFADAIRLMNESFSKPLHIVKKKNFNPKIVDDDINDNRPSITNKFNQFNFNYKQDYSNLSEEYKKLQSNLDIWREFEDCNLETFFIEKLKTANTLTEIIILSQVFSGIINSWLKGFNKSNNWKYGKEEAPAKITEKDTGKDKADLSFSDYQASNEKQLRTRKQISNIGKNILEERKIEKKTIVSNYINLGLER